MYQVPYAIPDGYGSWGFGREFALGSLNSKACGAAVAPCMDPQILFSSTSTTRNLLLQYGDKFTNNVDISQEQQGLGSIQEEACPSLEPGKAPRSGKEGGSCCTSQNARRPPRSPCSPCS